MNDNAADVDGNLLITVVSAIIFLLVLAAFLMPFLVAGYYALSRNGRARIRRRHVNARFLATGTTAPVIAVNPVPWRRLLITALCGAAALAVLAWT